MINVVVFCSDSHFALGCVRCFGEAGFRPDVICYGDESEFILSSKYVRTGYHMSKEEGINFLLHDYPFNGEKSILCTIPDPPAVLVDTYLDELKEKFYVSSAGDPGRVAYWMNKKNIGELAKKHGLTVPEIVEVQKGTPVPIDLQYPVFTKSSSSAQGGKGDEGICYSREELSDKLAKSRDSRLLVMPYIQKKREINYFGISVGSHIYMDYIDINEHCPKDGLGHYNKFQLCVHDRMYDNIISMLKETNYEGPFEVEFLEDQYGTQHFMEINFRMDGELYKLCEGVNLPAELCRLFPMKDEERPVCLDLKKEKFCGMSEFNYFTTCVLNGSTNFFVWLWQMLTADRLVYLNFKDLKPLFVFIKIRLKTKLRIT